MTKYRIVLSFYHIRQYKFRLVDRGKTLYIFQHFERSIMLTCTAVSNSKIQVQMLINMLHIHLLHESPENISNREISSETQYNDYLILLGNVLKPTYSGPSIAPFLLPFNTLFYRRSFYKWCSRLYFERFWIRKNSRCVCKMKAASILQMDSHLSNRLVAFDFNIY